MTLHARCLITLTLACLACAGVLASAGAAPGGVPVLAPTVIYVPEEFHTGGAYTAIQAAPDGRVYIGTTVYDGYAHLLSFIPATGRFESLAEMSAATGERTPGPYAQAKIHTKPAIAPDRRVYFGTKSGKPAADPRWQQNYPGGHLVVYDPRTGTTTDLGIIKPRVSIISVGLDPSRGLVYALTDPDGHLVVYDPRSRTFSDKGLFSPEGAGQLTRYLVVLANGDAYHRYGEVQIARYVAATGTIERIPLAFSGSGTYEPPYAVVALPDGRRFIGVGNRTGAVYLFEPRDRDVAVRILGSASHEAGTGSHYTITAAPDGSAYYTGVAAREELYIFRVGPEAGAPRIVGRVPPLGPPPAGYTRQVARNLIVQGSTVTPDGALIVMTAYPLRLLLFGRLGAR